MHKMIKYYYILIQNFHDLKDQKHILAMEDLLEMLHVSKVDDLL